jgi:hypothetical protein
MADHYEVEGIDAYNPAATQPVHFGVAILYVIVVVAVVGVIAVAATIAALVCGVRLLFGWIFEALGATAG